MSYSRCRIAVALVASTFILVPDADRFITSQNTCLFKVQNDLSNSLGRASYDACMAGKGYVLRDSCPAAATKQSCYNRKP